MIFLSSALISCISDFYLLDISGIFVIIGSLIDDARNRNWKQIDGMLAAIKTNKYGDVFTNSLIRLLVNYDGDKKIPTLN